MSYLGNHNNLLRTAIVSMLNVNPSNVIDQVDSGARLGGGSVTVTGDYDGQDDMTLDVEVTDNTIVGAPRLSTPIAIGVGNGSLSGLTADSGVVPQRFTLTLEDLGTNTLKARAQLEGVDIIARTAPGNGIYVEVDRSGIVSSATLYSLQGGELRANDNAYVGELWNFGGVLLSEDGTVPANAPRLRFGDDPQIYRQYKKWNGNGFSYSFSPAPVRTVASGSKVKLVTGTYTLNVYAADDTLTDTITNVVTRYDALSALRDSSTLVTVEAPIANNFLPGGMGITELSEQTSSYVSSMYKDGSDACKQADIELVVGRGAPTEGLTIRCVDTTIPGSEVWKLQGDVLGLLPSATTGVPYVSSVYSLRIPVPPLENEETSATMDVVYHPVARDEDLQLPSLCVENKRLGAAAEDAKYTFEYRLKPPPPCDCSTETIIGGPDDECLGIETQGEEVSDESRLIRVQRMANFVHQMVETNSSPDFSSVVGDVDLIKRGANILLDCLRKGIASSKATNPVWLPGASYKVDQVRESTTRNGYRYAVSVVTGAGLTGAIEPTWGTVIGGTTADNDITWTNLGKIFLFSWDDVFAEWQQDILLVRGGAEPPSVEWTASTNVAAWAVYYTHPTVRNGWLYKYGYAHTETEPPLTGATEPTWPTTRYMALYDGDALWFAHTNYWNAAAPVKKGKLINPGLYGIYFEATNDGTTGSSEPTWVDDGSPVTDGTVVWRPVYASSVVSGNTSGIVSEKAFERLRACCKNLTAIAGIEENFDSASTSGDGCWQDFDDNLYWWEYIGPTDERFLPLQTNHWQVLSILRQDADGPDYAQSTRKWGLGFKFGCPDKLQVGDQLVIDVRGTGSSSSAYQEGDTIVVGVTYAAPLVLAGGQIGNDQQTWRLLSSTGDVWPVYAFNKLAPNTYSEDGLEFLLTLGGVAQALGDRFEWEVEGGRMRYRINGGAWTSPAAIEASVSIGDGLSLIFSPGAAPSWVPTDVYSFFVEAVNGPAKLKSPTNYRASWHTNTEIEVDPGSSEPIESVFLAGHTIPSSATVMLLGSDDDFFTTPLSVVVPWREGCMFLAIKATHAKYKVTVSTAGAARWMHLGEQLRMLMDDGVEDRGALTKSWKLPLRTGRKALVPEVEHTFVAENSVTSLLDMLSHACEYDARYYGFIPHQSGQDANLVRQPESDLEIKEVFDFQPDNPDQRVHSFTLSMEPAL